jgi:hypothetical protein
MKFWVLTLDLPPSPLLTNQHVFLVSNFCNLAILVKEKKEKRSENSRKNVMNKKITKFF